MSACGDFPPGWFSFSREDPLIPAENRWRFINVPVFWSRVGLERSPFSVPCLTPALLCLLTSPVWFKFSRLYTSLPLPPPPLPPPWMGAKVIISTPIHLLFTPTFQTSPLFSPLYDPSLYLVLSVLRTFLDELIYLSYFSLCRHLYSI